jgi:hypothetical protein
MTFNEFGGDAARELIADQLSQHSNGILQQLSPYRPATAVEAWHATLRAVEELINVPQFGIRDEKRRAWLLSLPVGGRIPAPREVTVSLFKYLSAEFDRALATRFVSLLVHTAAFDLAYRQRAKTGYGNGISLDTIGDAIDYYQSRRRHLVSLLYTMPFACTGDKALAAFDALLVLLPIVEHSCITVTSLHQDLLLADILPDFTLRADGVGMAASHGFQPLEAHFLEPERASMVVLHQLRGDQIVPPNEEALDPKKIFSAAELRNSVKLIAAAYDAFGLNDDPFRAICQLAIAFSRHCVDDYFIAIDKQKFQSFLIVQTAIPAGELEGLLVNRSRDYAASTNAYQPFIDVGDRLVSNVNLLSRFLYDFKNIHLGSRKRFQIHSGFIFEDMVRRDLDGLGFAVTDIKRINRKEFDVVAIRDGTAYNFQCKNNWVDLTKIETDRPLFVRYNASLVSYYRAALRKEEGREQLILGKLGLLKIAHFVVSRFPVITNDPRIVPYNRLALVLCRPA